MSDPSALTSATSEQWDQLAELLVVTMPTDTAVDTVPHEACERERVNADPLRVRELCHRYIDYLIETRRIFKRDRTGRETLREGGVGTEYLGLWFLADSVARRWKLDLPERPPQQLRWCECDPPDAIFRGLLNWCNTAEKAIAGKQPPISLTPKLGPMEENAYAPNPRTGPFIPLSGWAEILTALNEHIGTNHFKCDVSTQDKIRKLNYEHVGPIIFPPGKGKQPTVCKTLLMNWWDDLQVRHDAREIEVASDGEAARIETADTHNYGRTGTVVPGIGGSVKLKRTSRKKGKEGKI